MKFKHGKSHNIKKKNVLYNRYNAMKNSCYNPKNSSYKNNGARGITVCDLWKNDFMEFYNWAITHGFTHQRVLHRTDRDKEFSPDNCRWITYKTKNKLVGNIIPTNKAKLDINGEIMSITELSDLLQIPYSKLYYYLTRSKVGADIKKINLETIVKALQSGFKPIGTFEQFKKEVELNRKTK